MWNFWPTSRCQIATTIIFLSTFSYLSISGLACDTHAYDTRNTSLPIGDGPDFPSNASAYNLTIPEGATLKYVTVGFGTQNYTCSLATDTPTWVPFGAMAELRDISQTTQDPAVIAKQAIRHNIQQLLFSYPQIGTHYFIPHQPKRAPAFFFHTSPKEYVVGSLAGVMPSPRHPHKNVPWLALKGIEGNASHFIFRTNTHRGVPPNATACVTEGQEANMRYSALYWFYQ